MSDFDTFKKLFIESPFEYFGAIFYGTEDADDHIGFFSITSDHGNRVFFNLKDIHDAAMQYETKSLTLIHSHPHSKNPRPSKRDLRVTELLTRHFSELQMLERK